MIASAPITTSSPARKFGRRVPSDSELKFIKDWLRFHDLELYGRKASPTEAKKMLEDNGIDLEGVFIGPIARKECCFWLNKEIEGDRPNSRRIVFDRYEWHQMCTWIRANMVSLSPYLDTVRSVSRRMRHAGISCNPTAVHEALKAEGIDLTCNPRAGLSSPVPESQLLAEGASR